MRKFLALTTVALTLGAYPAFANHTGQTMAGEDATLKVNGLVCDFCAQAIHKVFTKNDAVNDVLVDLDHMLIHIDYKDGQSIDDDTLNQMITDAGYTLVSTNASTDEATTAPMAEHDHDHSKMDMGDMDAGHDMDMGTDNE